ncbi:low affinity potassium transporter [Pleurotus ostreatus]|uniref:Potassium transport protein n=1 Tax=Pleurotus ostreatus TaxID=5322 RepID=A0A8H6ZV00_PLEOS|nr:low affinity potassium transporter [Pleurotus ostreatus]KAF7428771.1 low affinity potassium transporter [Pleurotus ostreatus]
MANRGLWKRLRSHLNFYRIHILAFIFTPLIFSAVFYASNGQYPISYIDSLFLCVSAVTVCGLATVDLSALTPWQQVLIFMQMCIGSPVFVSWLIVLVRKYYFAKTYSGYGSHVQDSELAEEHPQGRWDGEEDSKEDHTRRVKGPKAPKLRPDMIRRVDNDEPKLINPSGWITGSNTAGPPVVGTGLIRQLTFSEKTPTIQEEVRQPQPPRSAISPGRKRFSRRLSDPGAVSRPASIVNFPRYETVAAPQEPLFPRTMTVEFAPHNALRRRGRPERTYSSNPLERTRTREASATGNLDFDERRSTYRGSVVPGVSLNRYPTSHGARAALPPIHRGFGGFPMPHAIIAKLFRKFFPNVHHRLARTVTIPLARTITTHPDAHAVAEGAKIVTYLKFDAIVGRNSAFHFLTNEQLEQLGGVEYRALNALLWIVGAYHIGVQLLSFIVIAPYMSQSRWKPAFVPPQLHKTLASPWFSLFQVVSSYTNTGMSLVDQSMLPFQQAYVMIIFMIFLILAGNTAFVSFAIAFLNLHSEHRNSWIMSKSVPAGSRTFETLQFLLDHPRRCFIYLFPSQQTWLLLAIVLGLTFTDWFFFIVLDIGNSGMETIPLGVRFLLGLLQAVAVRAAGFGAVSLSVLAPAVKVLYVIMMYISVYPIAMSVRSTNVYEEQSLGIYNEDEGQGEEESLLEGSTMEVSRVSVWGRYLARHARMQLAFDMWWLVTAVFLVCIIERANLDAVENFGWFNIFNILFELVSAYGTVGLSLGIPTENYSFSGAFHPLSKLIVCAVMIRGRHRGLPVAIDRAVLPPEEKIDINQQNQEDHANQDQGYDGTAQLQQHYQQQQQRDGGDALPKHHDQDLSDESDHADQTRPSSSEEYAGSTDATREKRASFLRTNTLDHRLAT